MLRQDCERFIIYPAGEDEMSDLYSDMLIFIFRRQLAGNFSEHAGKVVG